MKLKLTLNIGKDDARALSLRKTNEGDVVDVPPDVADVLLKRGWGVDPSAAPEDDRVDLRAVPGEPDVTTGQTKAAPLPRDTSVAGKTRN